MVREKIVAEASDRMIAIADGSKRVSRLGAAPLPVEVLPFAAAFVADRLAAIGLQPRMRLVNGDPYRTDQDNLVLDCAGLGPDGLSETADAIDRMPGVLGHGLFLHQVDAAYIATAGSVIRLDRTPDC